VTLPYILGLLAGAGTQTLARRVISAWAPALAMLALLVAVLLLGTSAPAAKLLQGVVFGTVALAWTAVRSLRARPMVGALSSQLTRTATAAALLAVAAGAAVVVGPALPGGGERVVLRNYVTPPFDIAAYPSPLAGFRRYTESAAQLWDQTLLTVHGLAKDGVIRIATLDDYNGSVWGATNGAMSMPGQPPDTFQRVGPEIASPDASGPESSVTIIIDAAYAAVPEARAWLPTAGSVTGIAFSGARSAALADSVRFNLATNAAIVSDLLNEGDAVTITARLGQREVKSTDTPYGGPDLPGSAYSFTSAAVTKLAGSAADSPVSRLLAIAAQMKASGAYSDGAPGEEIYLPGHGAGRLLDFLNRPQLVGTDEHYAATLALMAEQLGITARVVLGATPEQDGAVQGKDVHAWVELLVNDAEWVTLSQDAFMPDRSKRPDAQPPQPVQKANAAVVPPPNVTKPLSSLDQAAQLDANAQSNGNRAATGRNGAGWSLPEYLAVPLRWGGPPVLTIAALMGSIIGVKALRRRRRRTRPTVSQRYASGWRELLDAARDLGLPSPTGQTRREQARAVDRDQLWAVAVAADAGTFGPLDASEPDTSAFWAQVDSARASLVAGMGRMRRFRAAVSVRSLLPRPRSVAGEMSEL
jgi:hypothetical protein